MNESDIETGANLTIHPQPIQLFYSYAHEDEDFRKELEKHLSLMRRNGEIASWHDRNINAGMDWKDAIHKHADSTTKCNR